VITLFGISGTATCPGGPRFGRADRNPIPTPAQIMHRSPSTPRTMFTMPKAVTTPERSRRIDVHPHARRRPWDCLHFRNGKRLPQAACGNKNPPDKSLRNDYFEKKEVPACLNVRAFHSP